MKLTDLKIGEVYGYPTNSKTIPCELLEIDYINNMVTVGVSRYVYEEGGKQGYKIFVGKNDQKKIHAFLLTEYTNKAI